MNTILTPVTLWKDFDDTLPLCEEVLFEQTRESFLYRELYFLGRKTEYGRVKIYAKYYRPLSVKECPAVLVMFEAGFPCDEKFVGYLLCRGFAVLAVDYCGDVGMPGRHTIYPRDVDYANYSRVGRAMDYVDETAKETSWYEWTAVARYAARYLADCPDVTRLGAIGLRTGGEILWKIAPYAPISCFISVCAAGWLAYRDMEKFADEENRIFDEERHRFIAGIDSQSYAPYVKCPVLMLSAINDKKCNYDRVYDTFQQINPDVEKAILYSAHGNGLIGSHSVLNINLFLDKFLKGRSVYLSKPANFSFTEEEDGDLKIRASYDPQGEIEECGVFFTEKISEFQARDWTRVMGNPKEGGADNIVTIPLDVCVGCNKMLVYTFARYSNGFSIVSKIQEIKLKNNRKKGVLKSRILYTSEDETTGFAAFRRRALSIADCFADGNRSEVTLRRGFGGIMGISSLNGIISYRVSEPRYAPPEGALFQFDAYCAADAGLEVVFYTDAEERTGYSLHCFVEGGGKWKKFSCESTEFKSERGVTLSEFSKVVSVVFLGENDVLINNVIWL